MAILKTLEDKIKHLQETEHIKFDDKLQKWVLTGKYRNAINTSKGLWFGNSHAEKYIEQANSKNITPNDLKEHRMNKKELIQMVRRVIREERRRISESIKLMDDLITVLRGSGAEVMHDPTNKKIVVSRMSKIQVEKELAKFDIDAHVTKEGQNIIIDYSRRA